MTSGVARLDLRLRRRGIVGYAVGMGLYMLVIVALYPSFKNDLSLNKFTKGNTTLAALFGANGSLTSPVGWLNANAYSNFLPLVVIVIALGYGAACLAGQDEDGTLAIVVMMPNSRRRIVAQKAVTLVFVAVPTTLTTLAFALVGRAFDLTVDPLHLLGVSLAVLLLGIDMGAIAMLVGGVTGVRAEALGIASAIAAAMYLISSLAPVTHWVAPVRFVSLFYWAVGNGQLQHGVTVGGLAVLVLAGAVFVAAAAVAFERLDVQ